jgi:hypothetical protein
MISLIGLSAVTLSMLQATVAAPTAEFRGCLREAAKKATTEKVAADGIEDFLRGACSALMGTLKGALVSFRMKNGMGKKAAADDAQMTIDDYVAAPADTYRFLAKRDAPATVQPAAAATPAPQAATATPAVQPATPQPPKP